MALQISTQGEINMAFDLFKDASERIIIAAHRGECGGNIPCNTLAAYEIAVANGADMIEVDVSMSADGTLWILHPKMEYIQLNYLGTEGKVRITELTDEEIRKLRYVNTDRTYTEHGLCTFDEVLTRFKDRVYINVDKFWEHPAEIMDAIKTHGMEDQIVVKTSPKAELFDLMEEYAPNIYFLPILNQKKANEGIEVHEELLKRNINYIGAEVVFTDDSKSIGSKEFVDRLHADGKLVWCNAILYNYKVPLSGGHTDDVSLIEDPAKGWGWIADRGYDFLQTDWTLACVTYLNRVGKRFKK